MTVNKLAFQKVLREALEEDLGFGDLTSHFFSPEDRSRGSFTAKSDGVLAGSGAISETYRLLDKTVVTTLEKRDGNPLKRGDTIATVEGPIPVLLACERVILNLVQHLSGIATATSRAVEALNDPGIRICDTRKTVPGIRMLQKYAVRCGGGYNHRYRLDDGVMIKDNHIKAAGSIAKAVQHLRAQVGPMVRIEVETETREQVLEAVDAGADLIMFDNRTPEQVRELVELVPDAVDTEVSGGITFDTVGDYRNTGVDYISMGSLTHSVTALDISFNLKM